MEEPFYEENWFYVPERELWKSVIDDEEPDLEPAENVLDDVLLFEVG